MKEEGDKTIRATYRPISSKPFLPAIFIVNVDD
jgi:hypothetical protein